MKLLCTDLDRTLLPNGKQLESPNARPILWHLLAIHSIALAYVSGRDLPRVLDAIHEYDLPTPDVIVADVGASLYLRDNDSWTMNAGWKFVTSKDWNGLDTIGIKTILQDIDGLQNQEEDRQSLHKRSYYFAESLDESLLRKSVETCLFDKGVRASIVISHDPEKALGLLDILPRSATKSEAVRYLQSLFKLPVDDVMFAGDSGNDVFAISAEHPSVLVANADIATREAVQGCLAESSLPASTYFAQGGLDLAGFDPLNGNYAAGIIEGLVHFRPQWLEYLQDPDWINDALSRGAANNELASQRSA